MLRHRFPDLFSRYCRPPLVFWVFLLRLRGICISEFGLYSIYMYQFLVLSVIPVFVYDVMGFVCTLFAVGFM